MLQRRRDDWLANCALALRMRTLLKGLSCSKMMSTLHFLILLKNHKAVKDSRSSLKVMKKIGNEFLLECELHDVFECYAVIHNTTMQCTVIVLFSSALASSNLPIQYRVVNT